MHSSRGAGIFPCLPSAGSGQRLETGLTIPGNPPATPISVKIPHLFVALLALFGLNSCLQNESTMTLKKDGSGTIVEETVMGAQIVDMMEQMGAPAEAGAPDPLKDLYDEKKYQAAAAGYGEGVEYVGLEKVARDGGKGVKVTYKFADINKVKFSPGNSLKEMGGDAAPGDPGAEEAEEAEEAEAAEAAVKEEPITFAYAGGKLTIKFPDPKKKDEGAEMPDVDDAQAAQAMAMMKDMRMAARLVIEPGIAQTNATHVKESTITLMDVRFGELLANEGGMKVMKQLETDDRAALAAAVKGMKGIELETQKEVTVELK